ncbi:MAG: hypothetical protein HC904_15265 [Blastochloris sp.]|nr:hypothetical protein [Blastochloris sp.]
MNNLKKLTLITLGLAVLGGGIVVAQTIYRYRCPNCSAVYSFAIPGIYKCPTDGWVLNPVR